MPMSSESRRPRRGLLRPHLLPFITCLAIASLTIVFLVVSPVGPSGHTHDELFVAAPPNATRAPISLPAPDYPVSHTPPTFSHRVESFVEGLGTTILDLFGVDTDAEAMDGGAFGAGGLASWAESSVFVEVTNSLHPSPFGPHLVAAPLRAPMYPISALTTSDAYGCASSKTDNTTRPAPPGEWIAVSQRGHCPFSAKVRFAAAHGAVGVLFGDMSVAEGGLGGMGGLLTPWSPDDTSDITIPSAFVSRASYLSLLKTWDDVQVGESEMQGLYVVLSKDELFAWPLLDFLLLLLVLPSLLTLLTVFTHRVRVMRQRKADRAPRDVVDGLPVFTWGERDSGEKRAGTSPEHEGDANGGDSVGEGTSRDEEASIGMRPIPESPTESTSLLRPNATATRRSTFFARFFPAQTPTPPPSPPPTSVPKRQKFHSLNIECAICMEDFVDSDRVTELPCGHLYHQAEIESWLLNAKRLAFLDKHDTFLFDLDGVVWSGPRGDELTPNVREAIELLRSLKKTLAFVTNNSTKSRRQYLAKFFTLGLTSVRLEEIFTCGSASATYLKDVVLPSLPPEQRGIYVIGQAGLEEELREVGLDWSGGSAEREAALMPLQDFSSIQPDPTIGVVLFSFQMHFGYRMIAKAYNYLGSNPGCQLVLTNDDQTVLIPNGVCPGEGAMASVLYGARKGLVPTIVGKPHQPLLDVVHKALINDRGRRPCAGG
ncbi:hypothetical protein RQP46_005554 [Phenoliferia psychrophenolica]